MSCFIGVVLSILTKMSCFIGVALSILITCLVLLVLFCLS
jgi:hypothetical protein